MVKNFPKLLKETSVERIYTNGRKAHSLYKKYCETETGIAATPLPSTSPANAAWGLERLINAWKIILEK